tara:strand:+ start:214 stop:765 length:552 start_codon:yes stop_codon:yes gene_type:complete
MRIIIRAVEERGHFIDYLKKHLPQAEWCFDEKRDAMHTFLKGMRMANDDPCIHMEEDIVLTKNFLQKATKVISQKPFHLIQFFSMRKDDIRVGSRFDTKFMMNQCHYNPPTYSRKIADFWEIWDKKIDDPVGYDLMMQDFLKSRKEKYWISVPSLVDHRVAKSIIDPRRSSKRQSLTFTDEQE